MGNFCHSLDLCTRNPGDTILSILVATANRRNSLALLGIKNINRITHGSRFGRIRATKWIGLRNSYAMLAEKILKGRKFARTTVRVTTPSFSKTPTATNSKFAAARSRYLLVDV